MSVLGKLIVMFVVLLSARDGRTENRQSNTNNFDIHRRLAAQSGDLVRMLAFTAATFHVPVVAELAQPYPTNLSLPDGARSPRQVLDLLIAASPGYAWQETDGVASVYEIKLRGSPRNFLNNRVKVYVMPGNAADWKLEFKEFAAYGYGGLVAGIWPPELANLKLSKGTVLRDFTARQILIEAGRENHDLFSLIVFPNANPQTEQEVDEAYENWITRSARTLPSNPIQMRSIAKRREKHQQSE